MIRNGFVATLAAWAALGATGAAAQNVTKEAAHAANCVTEAEAEAMTLALAPSLLRQVADICARTLPASAFLRSGSREMIGRYETASAAAMPAASTAIARVMGPQAQSLADSGLLAPMMVGMLTPVIAQGVKPESCVMIDRVLADVAPLPPANFASLVVTLMQIGMTEERRGGKPLPFEFCPVPAK